MSSEHFACNLAIFILTVLVLLGCSRVDTDYSDYGAAPVDVQIDACAEPAVYGLLNQCEAYCKNVKSAANSAKCQLWCIKSAVHQGGNL